MRLQTLGEKLMTIYRWSVENHTEEVKKYITGFSKSLSNVHIIIHHIQGVFQQLSNGVFDAKWNFSFYPWFSTHNKELSN